MTEQEQKIGDYISGCVNRQSFTIEDMEKLLILIKEAGYKSPEEVMEMFKGYEDTIKLLREQLAYARDG